MVKKYRISPKSILDSFSTFSDKFDSSEFKITTSQISDALKRLKGTSGAINGLKPINDNLKIMGSVITARTHSEDWGTVLKALKQAETGNVLFLQAESDESAIWGELTSLSAKLKGLKGTIVFGAMRDLDAVKKLNYPVFSRAIVPNAGAPLGNGQVNVPLLCKGVNISPGDIVVADSGGVVVIEKDIFSDVINLATKIYYEEEELVEVLKKGSSLSDLLGLE
jgi:3-hexulose-6-phosphate synthase